MSELKHHRHHFHQHKEEKPAAEMTRKDDEKQVKHHKHLEHVGKLGAVAAGSMLWKHEKHIAKKDPENAHSYRIKEEIAATIAVGSAGFAFHEKHEKKDAKKQKESAFGKRHHLF